MLEEYDRFQCLDTYFDTHVLYFSLYLYKFNDLRSFAYDDEMVSIWHIILSHEVYEAYVNAHVTKTLDLREISVFFR